MKTEKYIKKEYIEPAMQAYAVSRMQVLTSSSETMQFYEETIIGDDIQ